MLVGLDPIDLPTSPENGIEGAHLGDREIEVPASPNPPAAALRVMNSHVTVAAVVAILPNDVARLVAEYGGAHGNGVADRLSVERSTWAVPHRPRRRCQAWPTRYYDDRMSKVRDTHTPVGHYENTMLVIYFPTFVD